MLKQMWIEMSVTPISLSSISNTEIWYDKLFNVKYLPLFHHFKTIYPFPKHIIFWSK
jgi:hypothetical protein